MVSDDFLMARGWHSARGPVLVHQSLRTQPSHAGANKTRLLTVYRIAAASSVLEHGFQLDFRTPATRIVTYTYVSGDLTHKT